MTSLAARLWQPIETAPKDGTHILVGRFDGSTGFGYFSGKHVSAQTVAHYFGDGFYVSVFGGDEPKPQPWTHWMPLPPQPSTELDDANVALATESADLRGLLSELVAAVDGMEDLDEMDGEEFQRASKRLEDAMKAARPKTEAGLLAPSTESATPDARLLGGPRQNAVHF